MIDIVLDDYFSPDYSMTMRSHGLSDKAGFFLMKS